MFYSITWQILVPTAIVIGLPTILLLTSAQNPKLTIYHYRAISLLLTAVSLSIVYGANLEKHLLAPLLVPVLCFVCKSRTTLTWLDISMSVVVLLMCTLLKDITTSLENLLLLEFISLISTTVFFLFLLKNKSNFNLVKVLTPYMLINFIGYLSMLVLIVILANPALQVAFSENVPNILFGYICLKLLPIPAILLKDPIYKILTVNQLCWVITLQLGLFLIPIVNLTQLVNLTDLTVTTPLATLTSVVFLYNLTGVKNPKQLFLYSTPLFLVTVLFFLTTN